MSLLPVLVITAIGALTPQAHASGVLGVDYVPAGRADQVWVAEDQTSGTLVGEFDGLLKPALSPYGGWQWDRLAVLGGVAWARVAEVDWGGAGRRKTSVSGLRLAADVQYSLLPRELRRPTVWVGAGAYGVIPFANEVNSNAGAVEEEASAELSQALRARVAGYGGRMGLGGELELIEGLSLGLRSYLVWHRGQQLTEDTLATSSLWYPETALRLQFEFPVATDRQADSRAP